MPQLEVRSADEMEQDILAQMQERQEHVNGHLPVRLRSQLIKVERARLGEIMKKQLANVLGIVTGLLFRTSEDLTQEYNQEREAKLKEWGDRSKLYFEPMIEPHEGDIPEDVEDHYMVIRDYDGEPEVWHIVQWLNAPDKYYVKHMGNHIDQYPWFLPGDFSYDDNVHTAESILLSNKALDMGNDEVAFTLDAVRSTLSNMEADFRLIELSDYKLAQLLQGLGCVKIQIRTSTDGNRHRYIGAWQYTRPSQLNAPAGEVTTALAKVA